MRFFFFNQKTAYEMRISDWSSDVCSSDLFLGDYDYDTLEQRSVSATLIVDHHFSDAISVSSRARYIDARATFRELYPDVYSNPLNPFLDGTNRKSVV